MKKYDNYKNSGVEWLGEIPEHWEIKRIKHLFKEINERSFDGSEDLLSVSQYTGVTNKSERLEEGGMLTNASTLEGYKKVWKGDLVSNIMLAWNGSLGFSPFNGITSPAYSIYRLKTNDVNRYFHYLLRTELYKSEFKRNSSGVIESRLRLYTDDFFRIESILPPLEEQTFIANFLDDKTTKVDQAIAIKQKQIELLKERRQILIHKAVTRGLNENVKLKDSGVEWIGEIPEHWEVKKIKKLGKIINGFAFNSSEFRDNGVRVMKISNIQTMKVDWTDESFVDEKYYKLYPQFQIKKNDLVFALTRPIISTGIKATIVDYDEKILLNQRNAVLKPHKGLLKNWIYFIILNNQFVQAFDNLIDKTGQQPNISTYNIGNLEIPFPKLEEQTEIAEYIEIATTKIATAISLKEQEIEKLKEFKMSLIDGVVTGR